jgi:hypothetical protein
MSSRLLTGLLSPLKNPLHRRRNGMAGITVPSFTRREQGGRYDSICMKCFLTVVKGKSEDEIGLAEENHDCEYFFRERFIQDSVGLGITSF